MQPVWGEERRIQGFGEETWGEETTWETGVDGKMNLQAVGYGGTDWMDLGQGGDSWQTLVNAVVNLRVP
jgi:hypothetical protein